MPFTASHAAAAVPFFRTRLIPSAVIIGCMAPDLEYFLRLEASGGFGHTLPGVFLFDLPVSLLALWLFHGFAKGPLHSWLPRQIRIRVDLGRERFPARTPGQFVMVCLSILVGVATHIGWDFFTHRNFWPYHHWAFLRRTIELPFYGPLEYLRVFQHLSTLAGAAILLLWLRGWYRRTSPLPASEQTAPEGGNRRVFVIICALAIAAAPFRAILGAGVPDDIARTRTFFIDAVITAITVFWAEVILYGAVRALRRKPLVNV